MEGRIDTVHRARDAALLAATLRGSRIGPPPPPPFPRRPRSRSPPWRGSPSPRAEERASRPESDLQVAHLDHGCRGLEEGRSVAALTTTSPSASAPPRWMHAARRCSPASQSRTSSEGQTSTAAEHRGWNGHPDGICCGSGGSPPSPLGLWRNRVSPIVGNAPERLRVRVLGEEHPLGRSLLHDQARVHDRDPIGDLDEDREVVGDEEHREAELVLEALQQPQHLRLHHHVQRGRRLVRDHQRWLAARAIAIITAASVRRRARAGSRRSAGRAAPPAPSARPCGPAPLLPPACAS